MDERMRFVVRLLEAEKMAVSCREFAISRKTEAWRVKSRYTLSLAVMLLPLCAQANEPNCATKDLIGDSPQRELLLAEADTAWLAHATVCTIGTYQVAVASDADQGSQQARIIVFKDGRPLFERDKGSTLVYNPDTKNAKTVIPLVNIWHRQDFQVERLFMDTVPNAKGESVTLEDSDFDGQAETRMAYRNGEVVSVHIWYEDRWQSMQNKCVMMNKRCVPMELKDGHWQPKPR